MEGNNMRKNFSVKTVVAVAIGAALFFVLGRFVSIPSGIPNTNITLQYAVLGLLAAIYGPVAGGLIGFIGHTLIDLSWGGSPWWSWVIASALVGVVVGMFAKKLKVNEGEFGKKDIIVYVVANVIAHVVAWIGVAPVLDILIYAEPADKVFAQGAMAALVNTLVAVVVGGLLIAAYTKTIAKKGSLGKE
jgi:energy-coupling factor transport system substrate-specific component